MSETKTIGSMTERQRRALAACWRRASQPDAAAERQAHWSATLGSA